MKHKKYDVIIIGSGAGGGASAYALTKKGYKVLILEAGPFYDPSSDYQLNQSSWEKKEFPYKPQSEAKYTFAPLQNLAKSKKHLRSWNHNQGRLNTTNIRQGWKYHHVLGVGGSTLRYSGEAHRINPNSLKLNSRFNTGFDWPINYEDLEPYYTQAEKVIGVAGPEVQSFRPRSQAYPLPTHPISQLSQYIAMGCKNLGLDWEPNSVAILSQSYDGRPNCNYCGNCNRGCPRKDKGSVDVTFIKKAIETGYCTIKPYTKVLKVLSAAGNMIQGVITADKNNKIETLASPLLIISAGPVQTPRLLLNSKTEFSPDGLANASGQVGKNLMETLSWTSSGISNSQLNSFKGLPSDSICWNFNNPDSVPNAVGGCRFSLSVAESNLVGPINYAKRVAQGWGLAHKKQMINNFGKVVSITGVGEKLPNSASFISLDEENKDEFDLPLAKINSYINDNDTHILSFMRETCQKILKSAGIRKIFEEYGTYDFFSSTQTVGTCRMGKNPTTSVVNEYCQSHEWRNLYIVDASIFPSSGGGEAPSLTIQAMALRAAEHIHKNLVKSNS